MPLIALTGGIASGKSTVAALLAQHGAVVVDADAIVRDVQQPGSPVLTEIAHAFDGVVRADGSLDRAALAGRVFGDAEALARLNAIVHPAVTAEAARQIAAARAADPGAVVVYDVPLLAEGRGEHAWDLIVVTHAPAQLRRRRLVELRGMSEEDAAARIASQATDEERLRIADVVIETAGTLDETEAAVDALWRRLTQQDR